MKKKVFFVDDEEMIRKAVGNTLAVVNADVHYFSGAQPCLEAIANFGCDVLVTDINMPGMSGLELIRTVQSEYPQVPIIAITGYGDVPMAVSVMKAGAIDFIEKPLNESYFISAVNRALGEAKELPSGRPLTSAEQRVLKLVVSGLTNKEIAERLNRSIRTVENHRHRLSKKLEANSTADLVRIALKMGIEPEER